MKRYIAHYILIVRTAALALCAICILQAQVRAQGMTGYIVIFPSVGLGPGQSLRLTLFNSSDTPVSAQFRSHHTGGVNVVFGDGSVRFVRPGAFHSFDLKRGDIPLPGEVGTGRIQFYSSITLAFSGEAKPVKVSMEILSIPDGTSNTILFGEVIPSATSGGGNGNDTLVWNNGDGNDVNMGIVPGQTLRVTIFNPPSSAAEAGLEAPSTPVSEREDPAKTITIMPGSATLTQHTTGRGHVKIFDGLGNPIAQSPEQVIPPGEFSSFNFNRNEIHLPGEPGANRAQVRIKPFFTFEPKRLSAPRQEDRILTNLVSFEVIDDSTGRTTAVWVTVGFFEVVSPQKPQ